MNMKIRKFNEKTDLVKFCGKPNHLYRHFFFNQACKAILFYDGRGQICRILGRFFSLEIFTFLVCARTFVNCLRFYF